MRCAWLAAKDFVVVRQERLLEGVKESSTCGLVCVDHLVFVVQQQQLCKCWLPLTSA
jgi:hypothetical protein